MGSRIGRGALAVVVLAIGLVLAGYAPGAWACSCVGGLSRADHFEQAEVVFVGVVTASTDPAEGEEVQSSGDEIEYTVDVRSEQKGEVSDPALVKSARDGATCGYNFRVGRRYQIYGEIDGTTGEVTTNTCAGTEVLSAGEAAFTPAPLPRSGVDTTIAIVGGVILLATATGLAIRNRRATSRSRRA